MMQPPDTQRTAAWLWRFVAAWSLQGLALGGVLATGDTGHLPAWLLPPVLAAVAALIGVLSALPVLALRRVRPSAARWIEVAVAGLAGCIATLLLPLGVGRAHAAVFGTLAGAIAALFAAWASDSRTSSPASR